MPRRDGRGLGGPMTRRQTNSSIRVPSSSPQGAGADGNWRFRHSQTQLKDQGRRGSNFTTRGHQCTIEVDEVDQQPTILTTTMTRFPPLKAG